MKIIVHNHFTKRYRKLQRSKQKKVNIAIKLFQNNPFHPLLNNHALHHPYSSYRSINIGGDMRAIYEEIDFDTAHFIALGTHSELYK